MRTKSEADRSDALESEGATKSADEDADDLVSTKNIEQYSVPIAMTPSPKKSNTRNREN